MIPVSPVVPGKEYTEFVIVKDQKPYIPLPAVRVGDCVLSRWHMTWKERWFAFLWGDVYLWVEKSVGTPLQPVKLQVGAPK